MSQYSTGLSSVTNGSPTVTGTNTLWLANVTAGDSFTVAGDGVMYDVASVDSDTQITLSVNYAGVTAAGAVYAIGTGFTVPDSFPEMSQGDIETATIFTRAMRKIQGRFSASDANTSQAIVNHVADADPHTQYITEAPLDGNTYVRKNGAWMRLFIDELEQLILSLFGTSEQGAVYIPKPIVNGTQALFQDSAGTVPVTTDGDPVGRMLDQSGNGNHAIQTVSGSRPVYRTDGTLHWLEFDGFDDFLEFEIYSNPATTITDNLFLTMSGIGATWMGDGGFVYRGGTPDGGPFSFLVQSDRLRTWSNSNDPVSGFNTTFVVSQEVPYSFTVNTADSTFISRRSHDANGLVYADSTNINYRTTTVSSTWKIGVYTDYVNPAMTGLVIRAATATASEEANAERYISTLAGITT